jgi:hypothetical protein
MVCERRFLCGPSLKPRVSSLQVCGAPSGVIASNGVLLYQVQRPKVKFLAEAVLDA